MPEVTLQIADGVAVMTLDHPEVRNALTRAMAVQLMTLCDEIDSRPDVGVTIVRGAAGTFCSGADTREWTADLLSDEGFVATDVTYQAFVRVGRLRTPTIAAVRGAAVGAGLNLMLATDLRVIADDARVVAGFLRIGIHPGGGFFSLVGRTAGREAAAALGLFGEQLSGRDAVEHGLAWLAVPDEEVETRALQLAQTLAGDPLLAQRAVASLRRALGPPPISWDAALEAERGVQLWSLYRRAQAQALKAV
jgi:enoyl-CoA hydratase